MEDRVILGGLFVQIYFSIDSPSGDKKFFSVQGGHFSPGKFYDLLLGRKGKLRETFPHLLFLKGPQLKIINMPK